MFNHLVLNLIKLVFVHLNNFISHKTLKPQLLFFITQPNNKLVSYGPQAKGAQLHGGLGERQHSVRGQGSYGVRSTEYGVGVVVFALLCTG